MNPYYEPLHKQAKNLHFQYHDALDNPRHPMARVIGKEIRELQADFERGRSPRSIEHRLKMVENQIHQAEHSGYRIMSSSDSNKFHHDFEHMDRQIRKLPHY